MPKFLAGCHYNEEEISRHLKNIYKIWPVQMNDNKFATGQILKKPSRSWEGADFSWLSSKVSRTLPLLIEPAILVSVLKARGVLPYTVPLTLQYNTIGWVQLIKKSEHIIKGPHTLVFGQHPASPKHWDCRLVYFNLVGFCTSTSLCWKTYFGHISPYMWGL